MLYREIYTSAPLKVPPSVWDHHYFDDKCHLKQCCTNCDLNHQLAFDLTRVMAESAWKDAEYFHLPCKYSERVHQNIDLHDFTHLLNILKSELQSMQIEVRQGFIHVTENSSSCTISELKTVNMDNIRIKFNNIDTMVYPSFLIASILRVTKTWIFSPLRYSHRWPDKSEARSHPGPSEFCPPAQN